PNYPVMAWGADDNHVVTGGGDGILSWWDIKSGICVMSLECHQGRINMIQISPDRAMLASCSDDGTIAVCDARTGELLRTLRRDRPYERLNITSIRGLTEAQKVTLRSLGAIENRVPL
ncbi:MAG TPA: hypothetical protein VHL11_03970, partial [Phototrophicaceae bacterium]|nr:hypothetical protein [Phototrophicaceae bacterium]